MDFSQLSMVCPFLFMGLALGMDVFSVSLSLGMNSVPFRQMIWIGIVFGIFHIIMPFAGVVFGHILSQEIYMIADLIGGLLLVGLGTHMIFSSMQLKTAATIPSMGLGVFILALSVSIDSFTFGISLGMVGANLIWLLLFIGFLSMFLAWFGMLIGKRVNKLLGVYSEILGGSVLCSFGLYIIFT